MTGDRLALAVEKLRVARGVRFNDLAASVGLAPKALRSKILCIRDELSQGDADRIGAALEAPDSWPERTDDLPTERIALSAPPPTPEEEARAAETRVVVQTALARGRRAIKLLEEAPNAATVAEADERVRAAMRELELAAELARPFAEEAEPPADRPQSAPSRRNHGDARRRPHRRPPRARP